MSLCIKGMVHRKSVLEWDGGGGTIISCIYYSAVKSIYHILNKCLCLHNLCVCNVYLYVYINTHTYMYIFMKYMYL